MADRGWPVLVLDADHLAVLGHDDPAAIDADVTRPATGRRPIAGDGRSAGFGGELDAVAAAGARFVERAARLVHELGRTERVRRVARDAGRQRERVADRADASNVPRTRSAAHTAPASGVSSRIAPTIRSPSRHAASLSRNVRRTTSPTTPSACWRVSAVGLAHRVDLEDHDRDRPQRTPRRGDLLLHEHREVLLVVEAGRGVEGVLVALARDRRAAGRAPLRPRAGSLPLGAPR